MKSTILGSASALLLALLCLSASTTLSAQRGLKAPDLVISSCKIQKASTNELNVIWSITNKGDAEAQLVGANREPLVSYVIEGSDKKDAPGVRHNWRRVGEEHALNCEKTVLKPGESVTVRLSLPYIEQENLVCYQVNLETDQIIADAKRENNSIIAILIGL